MIYECACRECEGQWNEELPINGRASSCIYCESEDTYRTIGSTGFILRGGNWAYDGYGQEPGTKSVNFGAPSYEEKKRGKKVIADRIEHTREANKK